MKIFIYINALVLFISTSYFLWTMHCTSHSLIHNKIIRPNDIIKVICSTKSSPIHFILEGSAFQGFRFNISVVNIECKLINIFFKFISKNEIRFHFMRFCLSRVDNYSMFCFISIIWPIIFQLSTNDLNPRHMKC